MPTTRFAIAPILALLLATTVAMQSPRVTAAPPEVQPRLAAGPMPGHSAMRAVTVWLQGNTGGEVVLEYWPDGHPQQVRSSKALPLIAEQQFTAHIEIGGLEPGTGYSYRVKLNGKPVAIPGKLMFHTQPLWTWSSDPPAFRVVAGSCAYINDAAYDRPGKPYGDGYGIFTRMAEQSPDMMLWLGDNAYTREADFDSRWGMAERYRHTRALPELQPLLRSTHHYAIWDDHDYGPNEANRSLVLKDHSLSLFKRYWANPAYGLPGEPGIFTAFSFRDIDFFLLDNRYQRNSDQAPDTPHKSMLGGKQLAWLKDALLRSTAPFKIIANGSQMLNQFKDRESWRNFPAEQADFLDWLNETGISGVLFLSGDTHFSALTKLERENNYPLYELTCSPLTAGPRPKAYSSISMPPLPDTFVGERNFCQLDFSGPATARQLSISVFDANGKQQWQREIAAGELQSGG
ncbi:MAG: alkaline phosphatase D family protein [Thiogranum sp.]